MLKNAVFKQDFSAAFGDPRGKVRAYNNVTYLDLTTGMLWKQYGVNGSSSWQLIGQDVTMPYPIIPPSGGGDMLKCYDRHTEVLTKDGWMFFKDVKIGQMVATLNPQTHYLEYKKVCNKYLYDNVEKLYHIKSSLVDLAVTPNHKMYVQKRRKNKLNSFFELIPAKDIFGKRVRYKKDAHWNGNYTKEIKINNIKVPFDLYCQYMGYWLSEGCTISAFNGLGNKDYLVAITQVNPLQKEKMIECSHRMAQFFGAKSFINGKNIKISNKDLYNYLKPFGKSCEKYIPQDIMDSSTDQIKRFLFSYIEGDGSIGLSCNRKTKHYSIFTTSLKIRDQLQELALKVGWSAKYKIVVPKGKKSFIKGKEVISRHDCYSILFNQKKNNPQVNHGHSKNYNCSFEGYKLYNDTVHCVEVEENHILYVRRNGIPVWSGNSVYDVTNAGVVDNSQRLGGQLPAYYATDSDLDAEVTARINADATLSAAIATKQPLDADLTDIANLTPSNDDIIQRKSGTWVNRTPAQLKVDLALSKVDVGLSNVDNTSDVNKPISTATQTALDNKQNSDSDLTDIAALSPSNDDFIQRKSGAWTNRSIAQVKTDLGVGALTSIVRTTATSQTPASSTALADITGLSLSVAANEIWEFEFNVSCNTNANASGCRFGVNAPTGATINYRIVGNNNSKTAFTSETNTAINTANLPTVFAVASTNGLQVRVQGTIVNGVNAGTLQLRFSAVNVAGQITAQTDATGKFTRIL